MINVTLDTNCIIALEKFREGSADENEKLWAFNLEKLIQMHEEGEIVLRLVASSASERQRGGKIPSHFSEFKERVKRLGLGHLEILSTMGHWNIPFWDYGLWSNDAMEDFEMKIHEILFPDIKYSYKEYCNKRSLVIDEEQINSKWLNYILDTMALWCHLYYGSGIFVTSDRNFRRHKEKLLDLDFTGTLEILNPEEAVNRLKNA